MAEPTTSNYPTSLDSNATLGADQVDIKSFILGGSIGASDTSIPASAAITGITAPFYLLADSELIYVEGISGSNFTPCVRGRGGTTGASHTSGITLFVVYAANLFNQLKRAIIAIETELGINFTADHDVLHDSLFSTPGGRLTLTSGIPVTSADVLAATNIYYTPFMHNLIQLWNGTYWQSIDFAEKTLALGTMTAARGYDVFGYLSSGELVLEKLVWSSGVARATEISIQDGRYCKTGDKTRLYLGSFYSMSTTTTEDSAARRELFNYYNRHKRSMFISNGTAHNYNINTARPFNNDLTLSAVAFFMGVIEDSVEILLTGQMVRAATDGFPRISVGFNSTTVEYGIIGIAITAITGRIRGGSNVSLMPTLGYQFLCILELSTVGTAPGTSFEAGVMSGMVMQ